MPLPSLLAIGRPSRSGTLVQVKRPAYWLPGDGQVWLYVPKHAR
jgi:hypothetical protein